MTPWINYHHLYYFKAIAEEGSVSKAAAKLRLGQPTLSSQLKRFEEILGIRLFERKHKRLVISEQGKIALEYARNIFKMGNEMIEVLNDRFHPARVNVQVGALDSIAKLVLLRLAKTAYKIGSCHISLMEGKTEELTRDLLAHRLDLFVTDFIPTGEETKSLIHRLVVKRPTSIFGAPEFKLLRKNFPKSLSGKQFIFPTFDSRLRHSVEQWFRLNSLSTDIVAETQDISLRNLMAIEGLGLIPSARFNVERHVKTGALIEIGSLQGVNEELYLVAAQRQIANPIASHLMREFSV
ncbi:MAG: LysR family transcriptional regulator [Nitrospirae bacterium]|nr:LysR family transcriptional regulator [Nitrospirota bacterium]